MYNTLYKDFGDTLQRIHECEMIAMHNCIAHLQNKPYILPELRKTSLLEADIQKLNDITSVLNSGDFSQLLGNVEGISPLGLVYNNYLESTTNVSEKFDALRTTLKEQLNTVLESGDEKACSSFVKTVKDPSFATTICCGKKEMDEACFTTTGFKQVTVDDTENAKATLEGAKDKIKAHQDRMKSNLDKKKQVLQNMDKKMEDSAKKLNSAKKEDCDKICDEAVIVACYLEMSDMIDHAECVALTNQILEETKQAYTILRMLQEHNARNIKESKVVTGFIQEMAMNSFDEFVENAKIPKATVQSIQEGKVQDAFDKLKAKMIASNERFLKKHKDAALASKCDGIIIDKWYEPKDIDKIYKETMAMIKKEMDPEKMDVDELKDRWRELRGSLLFFGADSKANKISSNMVDGKHIVWIKKVAHNITRKHKVTPADVKEAVKFLETSDREIDKATANYTREFANMETLMLFMIPPYVTNTLLRTKGEKYVKKINNLMQYVIDNVNINYRSMLLSQLKVKQEQSRAVIIKAARVSSNEAVEILEKEFTIIESAFDDLNEVLP